jgi:hypothetical protein
MPDYGSQPHSSDLFVDNRFQIFYGAGIIKLFPIGISIPALIKGSICATLPEGGAFFLEGGRGGGREFKRAGMR